MKINKFIFNFLSKDLKNLIIFTFSLLLYVISLSSYAARLIPFVQESGVAAKRILHTLPTSEISEKLQKAKAFELVLDPSEKEKQVLMYYRTMMSREIYGVHADHTEVFDEYDKHSSYCIIKKNAQVLGGGRLVLGQAEKVANSFEFQADGGIKYIYPSFPPLDLLIGQSALASRLYIDPEARGEGAFLAIFKGYFHHASRSNKSHIFSEFQKPMIKTCWRYGLAFEQISEYYIVHGVERAIHYANLQKLFNRMYINNPLLWKFMTDQGTIFPYRQQLV